MKQVTRKALRESIESIQANGLGVAIGIKQSKASRKQLAFAEKVVLSGLNASQAYRESYNTKAKPNTVNCEASKLMKNPKVANTIMALEQAKQASALHSAESLKALVVATLVDVATNSERDAVRVAAVKTLGTVVGVDMFRETKRIETVKDSDDIKQQIMDQLKTMMLSTDDALTVDAHDLLAELVGDDAKTRANASESGDYCDSDNAQGTHPVPPEIDFGTPASTLHTIPLKPSDNLSDQDPGSPIPLQSTPLHLQNEDGGGDIFSENAEGYQDATGRVSTLKVKS
jgi:hypothetical protein